MPNNANQLATELIAVAGFDGNGNMLATTGATISMIPIVGAIATVTVTLTRRPATSAATVAANAFVADVPGLFIATVQTAGASATYRVLAFPAAAFAAQKIPASGVMQLMPQVTPASAAASLELPAPGLLFGVNQILFGGTSTNGVNWAPYAST